MREPDFWWARPGLLARLLWPVSLIYGAVAAWRMNRSGTRAGIPVICVGNFTLGGTGKTPTAIAIAKLLAASGEKPFFLSRGYGGNLAGPIRVDPAKHAATDVGDEPLLLARAAPVIVSRDRVKGAELAKSSGATVIVMDDGLQNPSLAQGPFDRGGGRTARIRQWLGVSGRTAARAVDVAIRVMSRPCC